MDPSNILIVDNSPFCFALNLKNGIPIIDFFGSKTDNELIKVMKYVKELSKSDNVMEANEERLHLQQIFESSLDKFISYYQIEELSESDEEDFMEDGQSVDNDILYQSYG